MGSHVDHVWETYYKPHLHLASNTSDNRRALWQRMYTRVMMELCANRFKWRNLPDNIDERFLEMTLLRNGLAVFFHDDKYGYLTLRASMSGAGINMFDNPLGYQVYGNRFVNKTIDATDCVPIWSNYTRMPDWDIISLYSGRLADLETTREINSKNMRQNRLIFADENSRKSMNEVNRQIDRGQSTIFATPGLDPAQISAVNTDIHPDSVSKLAIERSQVWNDCMTLLGINNANQDKRERVQAAEVEANNEQVDSFKNVALNARRQAATAINDMFGLSIEVDFCAPDDVLSLPLQAAIKQMEDALGEEYTGA